MVFAWGGIPFLFRRRLGTWGIQLLLLAFMKWGWSASAVACGAAVSLCKGRSVLAASWTWALIQRLRRLVRLSEVPVALAWQRLLWVRACWHPPHLVRQQQQCSSVCKSLPRRPQRGVSDLVQARGRVLSCSQQWGGDGAACGTEARFSFYPEKFSFCGGYGSNRTRVVWTSQRSVDHSIPQPRIFHFYWWFSSFMVSAVSISVSVLLKQMLSWWYLAYPHQLMLSCSPN